MTAGRLRQAAGFVALSGAGWLLDLAVFLTLSGRVGWDVLPANLVSGSCGTLLVFLASSRGLFRRNAGSMTQKAAVLLSFNFIVIAASSVVLAGIAQMLSRAAAGFDLQAFVPRLGAKVLVTPVTLALNFVVIRYLLERFTGLRLTQATP